GLPDAPALPSAAEADAEPLLVVREKTVEANPPAVREDEVISVPIAAAVTPEEPADTELLCVLSSAVSAASDKKCPAFMPYIEDDGAPALVTPAPCACGTSKNAGT